MNSLTELNKLRSKQSLELVKEDSRLVLVAQKHADWMNKHKNLSHEEGDLGLSLMERVLNENISYSIIAENVAEGVDLADEVIDMWLDSSIDKHHMLSNYKYGGMAFSGFYCCLVLANLWENNG